METNCYRVENKNYANMQHLLGSTGHSYCFFPEEKKDLSQMTVYLCPQDSDY